jgi:ferredoxin
MRRVPVIDTSRCTDCESCLEICPIVFKRNKGTGLIEIADLSEYPENEVREAIAMCPEDCISWEEVPAREASKQGK